MLPLRWKVLPFALFLALFLPAVLERPAEANREPGAAAPASAPAAVQTVELSDLRADPLAHLGRGLRFELQFAGLVEDWNPLTTRFGTDDWVAFSAWSDEEFTWDPAVYENPQEQLFVRRDGALHRLLTDARPYERFSVTARVRAVLLGQPWIEVESMQPLLELVGEGTILHVTRAMEFARKGQWRLATEQFERARSAPLPANARQELERRIAECNRLAGL